MRLEFCYIQTFRRFEDFKTNDTSVSIDIYRYPIVNQCSLNTPSAGSETNVHGVDCRIILYLHLPTLRT